MARLHTLEDYLLPDSETIHDFFMNDNEDDFHTDEEPSLCAFSDTPEEISCWMEHASEKFTIV